MPYMQIVPNLEYRQNEMSVEFNAVPFSSWTASLVSLEGSDKNNEYKKYNFYN